MPKTVAGLVAGIVLTALVALAAKSYLSTESQAAVAKDATLLQGSEIEHIKEDIKDLKQDQSWLKDSMLLLLQDRGIKPPQR